MIGYKANIEELTRANTYFRHVIFTGPHAQLVLMTLKPGEEIGMEVHPSVDQFFRFEVGQGKVTIAGTDYAVKDGDVAIVPAGNMHNVTNTGSEDLKLYTLYSPPNHPDGTIHKTKAEAMVAEKEEHK
jgi:mannose-6-phosphate isomerase-like protein (cupin superfamily)